VVPEPASRRLVSGRRADRRCPQTATGRWTALALGGQGAQRRPLSVSRRRAATSTLPAYTAPGHPGLTTRHGHCQPAPLRFVDGPQRKDAQCPISKSRIARSRAMSTILIRCALSGGSSRLNGAWPAGASFRSAALAAPAPRLATPPARAPASRWAGPGCQPPTPAPLAGPGHRERTASEGTD